MDVSTDQQSAAVRTFPRRQRRVLGALIEKAFTTPEYYPLTLKALTTACNQKNNRHPVTNYSEEEVQEIADELRELGLLAVVHTETGRTERYRHYLRKAYEISEAGLAILGELFLRGRQQLGELRTRVSRMVPIESLDVLRDELTALMQAGYVRASGPLERRGIEVDHNFYEEPVADWASPGAGETTSEEEPHRGSGRSEEASRLAEELAHLREQVEQLTSRLERLESLISG